MRRAIPATRATERTTRLIDIETAIDSLDRAFVAVADRMPDSVVETAYRVAGHPVRVRVAGAQLAADLDKALCHLRAEAGTAPALSIEIWNDAEVGPVPWAPWPEDADTNGTVSVSDDDRFVLTQRPSSVMLLDRQGSRIVGCVRRRDRLFQDERARPFHRLISIWLDDRDIQFIHAGLVARGEKGLLLVGKSGSGKTTASIACFLGGFTYLSDDYVALEATAKDNFVGHSLYATCLVDRVYRFPALASIAHAPNHGFETKHSVYLADHQAGRFATGIRLAAVVLLKVVDRPDTVYRPAKTIEAMLALAPSSVWILPNSARNTLGKLEGLVTTVPAFWLELGRDVNQISPAVERLWGGLTG